MSMKTLNYSSLDKGFYQWIPTKIGFVDSGWGWMKMWINVKRTEYR